MKDRFVALGLAVALLGVTVPVRSFTPPVGSPLATREHPRLLVTTSSLPALRAKLGTGGVWANDFRTWIAWADSRFAAASDAPDRGINLWLPNFSLIYLTYPVTGVSYGHTRAQYGDLAKRILMRSATSATAVGNYDWYSLPLAYDWLYPLLSTAEKHTLVTFMKTIDVMGLTNAGADPFNSQVAVARAQKLLSGLAFAGDGVDDAWAGATLDRYPEFFSSQTGVTRAESDLGGDDGSLGQGLAYGLAYTAPHVLVAEEGWRVANGLGAAAFWASADKSFIRRLPQYFAYMILPWGPADARSVGGRRYVLWKTQRSQANTGTAAFNNPGLLTAITGVLRTADPQMSGLAQWLRDNRVGEMIGGDGYYQTNWALWKFVLGDRVTPVSPTSLNLPTSKAFRDGKLVFRTGWDSLDDSYVTFLANRWQRNPHGMSPNVPGAFTIDRKGPQVIHQAHSGHNWAAGNSSGPANILTFVDPSQTAALNSWDDHGGQRLLPGEVTGSHEFVPGAPLDTRGALKYFGADRTIGRDVDYVSADITRAYNSTRYQDGYNAAKVSEVVREFVYFRPTTGGPDRVVILDRATTTDTRYEKRWLFHTSGEPVVNGTQTRGVPIRHGTGVGKSTFSGATLVTATNTVNGSNGRTFLTPLLPSGRTVVKVGGPNGAGLPWQPDSHEFEDPFGVLHPDNPPDSADTAQYVGSYRVEIIPTARALTDVFLNVVEVTDSGVSSPSATVSLASTNLVAARVGNRIAVFNRVSSNVNSGDITIDAAGSYGIHFSDLVPNGDYEVTVGGAVSTSTASPAGTIYIQPTVVAGTRVAVRATGVVTVVAPDPPSGVRIVR